MSDIINEKIYVLLKFDPYSGKVTPQRIKWQGRVYKIVKVGGHYPMRLGRKLVHYFGVVSEDNTSFKLKFDTENLHWTLEEVFDEFADLP